MSKFKLSKRSITNLYNVNLDLVRLVKKALELSDVDFSVIEGKRTEARQRQLVLNGKSKTMNSRHLTGHAVDVVPIIGVTIPWEDKEAFAKVSNAMKAAAIELGVDIEWGGDWANFYDGAHYQLTWSKYPK